MAKVVLTKSLSPELLSLLQPLAELIPVAEQDPQAFEKALPDAEAVLLSTAYKLDSRRISLAPKLRLISRTGVGVDNVDVGAASAAGILVLNTPTANTETVAEHTVALILALVKQLAWLDRETRAGHFSIRRRNLGHDLRGRVLGLIGCGRIGRLVAGKMQQGFGLRVLAFDPAPQPVEGVDFVADADELCRSADIISLHVPLLESTRHFLDARRLSLFKPDAYLVNTSRGGLIDETALARMLQEGKLAGAALDVFSQEPLPSGHPLLDCPNTILTPHVAALTEECNLRVARQAVQGIVDYLEGRRPEHIVNPAALKT